MTHCLRAWPLLVLFLSAGTSLPSAEALFSPSPQLLVLVLTFRFGIEFLKEPQEVLEASMPLEG